MNKSNEAVIVKVDRAVEALNRATRAVPFKKELAALLNKYSQENGSDTPDFILAEYLVGCIEVFNNTQTARSKWYGTEELADEE